MFRHIQPYYIDRYAKPRAELVRNKEGNGNGGSKRRKIKNTKRKTHRRKSIRRKHRKH